jgi:hypothetical protein
VEFHFPWECFDAAFLLERGSEAKQQKGAMSTVLEINQA